MTDPLWKTILNWGTVIAFFVMPLTVFVMQTYSLTHPGWIQTVSGGKPQLDYLREMMRNITMLTFGLAGLKTWEQIKANGTLVKPNNK